MKTTTIYLFINESHRSNYENLIDGKFLPVQGVRLEGTGDYHLYLHKSLTSGYDVTEATLGMRAIELYEHTRKGALQEATERLGRVLPLMDKYYPKYKEEQPRTPYAL